MLSRREPSDASHCTDDFVVVRQSCGIERVSWSQNFIALERSAELEFEAELARVSSACVGADALTGRTVSALKRVPRTFDLLQLEMAAGLRGAAARMQRVPKFCDLVGLAQASPASDASLDEESREESQVVASATGSASGLRRMPKSFNLVAMDDADSDLLRSEAGVAAIVPRRGSFVRRRGGTDQISGHKPSEQKYFEMNGISLVSKASTEAPDSDGEDINSDVSLDT